MNIRELVWNLLLVAFLSLVGAYSYMELSAPTSIDITPIVEEQKMCHFYNAYLGHTKLKMMFYNIDAKAEVSVGHFEEEISEDFNCLFYATQPIGRYYITAYNHKETGSKMTASGKTCHEGTITTCAADPRYHKFGTYLEIDGRLYRVEDTGSSVKKRHIDLYFASYSAMSKYGSNYQNIYKVEFPFGVPKDA